MRRILGAIVILTAAGGAAAAAERGPAWPPPPDAPRVEYVGEVRCADLKPKTGFFGKISRLVGGRDRREELARPFDLLAEGGSLYMTCRDLPALVEVDLEDASYRLHECPGRPLVNPVSLCAAEGGVYVTDSGNGGVYRFDGERLEPFAAEGLVRPTGIAYLPRAGRFFVVDTGDHRVKILDGAGTVRSAVGGRSEAPEGMNFPTFAAADPSGDVLVNDSLHYSVKRFDREGRLRGQFGREGDGPGCFARPKGLGVDRGGNVYVVDNLFDNVQVFDSRGALLLVIGGPGQGPGQFWSPGGICVAGDSIFIADTYNDRVQILRRLEDG